MKKYRKKTINQLKAIKAKLEEMKANGETPTTLRGLWYRLLPGWLKEAPTPKAAYALLSRVVKKGRIEDDPVLRIDPELFKDDSRPKYEYYPSQNAEQFLYAQSGDLDLLYKRDLYQDQDISIEIWCEKNTVCESIWKAVSRYRINVYACGGNQSQKRLEELAKRWRQNGKKRLLILYCGDFDPSGWRMDRSLDRRFREEVKITNAVVLRVIANAEDLERYNFMIAPDDDDEPDTVPIKDGDTQAKEFRKLHGDRCLELDAIPLPEIQARLIAAIEANLDMSTFRHQEAVEAEEKSFIASACDAMRETVERLFEPGNEVELDDASELALAD